MSRESGEHLFVQRALERHDDRRQVRRIGPAPRAELRMRGGDVHVRIGAGEAEQEPALALAAEISNWVIAAWATGDRNTTACNACAGVTSSTYRVIG